MSFPFLLPQTPDFPGRFDKTGGPRGQLAVHPADPWIERMVGRLKVCIFRKKRRRDRFFPPFDLRNI